MNCGSWINLRTYFCAACHQRCLKQFNQEAVVYIENVPVRSLLRWPPGESDVLSSLVLQLKDEPQASWNIWAEEFLLKWGCAGANKTTQIITSESSSGKRHAQNWGDALAQITRHPHDCPLKPQEKNAGKAWAVSKKQRELSRLERAQRSFDLSVDFSTSVDTRIIFADDVVTTGQTALAAYDALKEPSDFEVWCLIYREL